MPVALRGLASLACLGLIACGARAPTDASNTAGDSATSVGSSAAAGGGATATDVCADYVACTDAPAATSATELRLGTGKACYAAIDGPVPLISGPQGGYHVWVAVRASGFDVAPTLSLRLLGATGPLGLGDPMVRAIDLCPVANGWLESPHFFGFVAAADPNVAEALVGTEATLEATLSDGAHGATATQAFTFGAIEVDAHHDP